MNNFATSELVATNRDWDNQYSEGVEIYPVAPFTRLTRRVEEWLARRPLWWQAQRLYYRWLVAGEIARVGIGADDLVLCIGGGPSPFTAMEIVRRTGARVVVIDCDRQAVKAARRLVADRGLAERIEVRLADGRFLSAAGFQVVHIARQAAPQKEILANLQATAAPDTRILRRRPLRLAAEPVAL